MKSGATPKPKKPIPKPVSPKIEEETEEVEQIKVEPILVATFEYTPIAGKPSITIKKA